MDTHITIFLALIVFCFSMGIIGIWKRIPLLMFIGGAIIAFWAISTENIIVETFLSEGGTTTFAYNVESLSTARNLNHINHIFAERVTATSQLIGDEINCIDVFIAKDITGSPTGTAIIGIFNSTGGVVSTFGTQDVALLPTSPNPLHWRTYCMPTGSYIIQSGDYIGIKYTNGSATAFVANRSDNSNPFDGVNTVTAIFSSGGVWSDVNSDDMTQQYYLRNDNPEIVSDSVVFEMYAKIFFGLIGSMLLIAGALIWKFEED